MPRKPIDKRAVKTSISLPPDILRIAKETGNLSQVIKRALIFYFRSDDYATYRKLKELEMGPLDHRIN